MIKAVKVRPVFKQPTQLVAFFLQQVDQFRMERARLEQILDAKVETAEELSLAKYVSSANEVVKFPRTNSSAFNGEVVREADEAQRLLRWIRMKAETAINAGGFVFFLKLSVGTEAGPAQEFRYTLFEQLLV